MPPKTSKSSTKNAPNQHDKRHESGLAPPGKRVVKQRSNGQLNGHAMGKSAAAVQPPQLPSSGLNQGLKFPRPADNTAENAFGAVAHEYGTATEGMERDRTASDASLEEVGYCTETPDNLYDPSTIEGPAAACKPSLTPTGSNLAQVLTILACYPLQDAISILILLLSLPPPLVLVIQTLFASLTFVPPNAGLSLSALPSFKDILNTTVIAAPALWTILMVDLLIGLLWMAVWKPVQSIFLDMSQVAIAVSLSGAAASPGGPSYSIATCTILVCVVHVLRYKAIHLTALDYLRSVIHKMDIGIALDASSYVSSFYSSPPTDRGWLFTVIRTILGIHIVSQGVTTCVRYSLVKTKKDQIPQGASKSDPEANAGADSPSRSHTSSTSNTSSTDSSSQSHSSSSTSMSTSTDGRHPGPSPAHRESKSRDPSKSKKRKQANQARSQQPLWAAIASTKLTFFKEIEQREVASDARAIAALEDNAVSALPSLNRKSRCIWFRDMGHTEIHLCVDLSASAVAQTNETYTHLANGIDKTKPFYIRVNGAAWPSARIDKDVSENGANHSSDRYLCVIFGLAPCSTYHCEIVTTATQAILDSASFITAPAPTAEQSTAAHSPSQSLRPSSPSTTLRQSIRSSEVTIAEIRARAKKTRKDLKAVNSEIRKEIQQLRGKLGSSGGQDDKQDRRLIQMTQTKHSAEEAIVALQAQIDALGEIPADELAAVEVQKRAWESAGAKQTAAEQDRNLARSEQDTELGAINSEIAAAESKKEKLVARRDQRVTELEKLAEKEQNEMSLKEKRNLERSQAALDRERTEAGLHRQIKSMEAEAQTFEHKASGIWQELYAMGYYAYSSPPTPEGALSGNTGAVNSQANGLQSTAFGPSQFQSPFEPTQPLVNPYSSNANGGPRGRSSSMLSQISGFTENTEDLHYSSFEPRHQNTWPMQGNANPGAHLGDIQASDVDGEGSGYGGSLTNGSTNGSNSPRPDAKVFVPAGPAVKSVGTIGPPSKKSPQSPTPASAGAVGSGR